MSVKDKDNAAKSGDTDNSRGRVGEALETARERAIDAYDSARERASTTGRKASETLAEAPLIALGGGLAIGALLASLLPRTQTEKRLLGPVSDRITGAGREAFQAAKTAGRDTLSELNITSEAGKSAIQSVIDGIGQAAKSSGQAALGSVRNKN